MSIFESLQSVVAGSGISEQSLEDLTNQVYREIYSSFSSASLTSARQSVAAINEYAEGIAVQLGCDDDPAVRKGAYWGQIAGLLRLVEDLSADYEIFQQYKTYLNTVPHFKGFMEILFTAKGSISGPDFRSSLGGISDREFKRITVKIEDDDFYFVRKLGNKNFYSISPRGRSFYLRARNSDNATLLAADLEWLDHFIDAYGKLLRELDPSPGDIQKMLMEVCSLAPRSSFSTNLPQIQNSLTMAVAASAAKRRETLRKGLDPTYRSAGRRMPGLADSYLREDTDGSAYSDDMNDVFNIRGVVYG